jgi:hypothetical protein
MGYKTIVANADEFTNESMGLYTAIFSDGSVFLDLDKGSDKTIVADFTFIQIYRFDNDNIYPKLNISNGDLFYLGLIHDVSLP